ncbi:MAG: MFS transporter [Hyphomicrobiales bacterium]|nr:MAG: MFS transporter [Hyphomicrobiales bacterium]
MTRPLRPIVALAVAEIVSLLGTRLSMLAIPWLVLTTTGDPLLTGLVGFAEMLPYVLAKALGGPLIDRLGARRISITADLASMLAVALVPLLHFAGALRLETLLPIVVLLGTLRGPADAAKQAMIPAVAALANVALERVTGIVGTIDRLAGALGAAAAGALVVAIGAAPALAATALTCALAALVVAFGLRLPRPAPATAAKSSYLADLGEGWRYFRTDPVLVGIVGMIAVTNLFDQAYSAVLLPVWASLVGDAALLGSVFATFSAAAVAGAVLATLLAPRLPRLLVYTTAFLICGAPRYLIFLADTPLLAIFIVVATAGFASGFINPIISAVIFERIPAPLVGRVNSLIGAVSWGLIPFGGLVGGALIAAFGLKAAFAISGLVYFAATMLPLAVPAFRGIGRRQAEAVSP